MENASKALIIAGAILLAIVLVSLGVLVINNARGDIENQNIDQATIDAFNAKFLSYCGKNKSGSDMNSLMDAIAASNGAQKNKADKHFIAVTVSKTLVNNVILTNGTEATGYSYGYMPDGKTDTSSLQTTEKNASGAEVKVDTVHKEGYPVFDESKRYQGWVVYDPQGYVVTIAIGGTN